MKQIFVWIVFAISALLSAAAPAFGDTPSSSLDAIGRWAEDLCAKPELYGYAKDAQGHISGTLSIPLLNKRLANLGLGGKISAEGKEWKGIPQAEIAASLSDYRHCTQNMVPILVAKYGPQQQTASPPHHHHRASNSAPPAPTPSTINNCSAIGTTINATYAPTCTTH